MILPNYREDPGLDFLQFCSHEDLDMLAEILATGQVTGNRSTILGQDQEFMRHRSEAPVEWKPIAAELQRFGADSIASVFRLGQGVEYREILTDVCKHLKVSPGGEETSLPVIESRLPCELQPPQDRRTGEGDGDGDHRFKA